MSTINNVTVRTNSEMTLSTLSSAKGNMTSIYINPMSTLVLDNCPTFTRLKEVYD